MNHKEIFWELNDRCSFDTAHRYVQMSILSLYVNYFIPTLKSLDHCCKPPKASQYDSGFTGYWWADSPIEFSLC